MRRSYDRLLTMKSYANGQRARMGVTTHVLGADDYDGINLHGTNQMSGLDRERITRTEAGQLNQCFPESHLSLRRGIALVIVRTCVPACRVLPSEDRLFVLNGDDCNQLEQ